MSLLVMKFGGSSVKDLEGLTRAAAHIAREVRRGALVAAVVSARGDATDRLLEEAASVSGLPDPRELDALLAAGEQMSAALLAMRLDALGVPALSLTGWQAGFLTGDRHGDAPVLRVEAQRVRDALAAHRVPVVAGFQGVDRLGDLTTLGRGGSDTSAVALAAALNADECRIYTDVDGVYTADPRTDPSAKKLDFVDYDLMLAMARGGAKVLHDRAVLLAKKHRVRLWVLSSLEDLPGTLVGDTAPVACAFPPAAVP